MGCLDDRAIDDLVAGRLDGVALGAADAHLDRCTTCSAVVAAMLDSPTLARASDSAERIAQGSHVGRYIVGERIGEGAMGVVYVGFDPKLERNVALKLLHPGATDQALSERLSREGQAMARLGHPNVVAVYDVDAFEGRTVLAMELVVGVTLREWMTRAKRPWRQCLELLLQAGEGLAAAHDAGLTHRDFKPDNVLVGNDGRVRVTDLGLARPEPLAAASETLDAGLGKASSFAGTPAYMAPEQLEHRAATPQSDQFAFATTLWEVIAGERPFPARSLHALGQSIRRGPPSAPAGMPAWLARALRRALAYDPADRFPSMRALLDTLRRRSQRSKALLAGVSALALLAGGVAIGARVEHGESDRCALDEKAFEAWDVAREGRVGAAFEATHAPGSARAFAWARDDMRRYRSVWLEAAQTACREGLAGEPKQPLWASCLATRKRQADAIGQALESASPGTVAAVDEVVGALTPPSECLLSTITDAGASPDDEPFDGELAQLSARVAAGELAAAPALSELLARARTHASRTMQASILLVRARLARSHGNLKSAAADAEESLLLFQAAGDDGGVVRAWLQRVAVEGERGSWATAASFAKLAEASLARAGNAPGLAASLNLASGVVKTNLGELETAERLLLEAKQGRSELFGASDPRVAETLTGLGVLAFARGEFDSARSLHEAALAIDASAFGDEHPALARHEHNLGGVLRKQGKLDEAERHYQRALALETAGFGAAHPSVARTHNSLGLVALERGQLAAADEHFALAETLLRAIDHGEAAVALENRGVLELRRGNAARARDHLNAALGWLAGHGREGTLLHAQVLSSLGEALAALGEAQGSRETRERARGIARASGGRDAQQIVEAVGSALSAGASAPPTAKANALERPRTKTTPTASTTSPGVYAPAQTLGQ